MLKNGPGYLVWAKAGGWRLKIDYVKLKTPDGVTECVFRFRREKD